MLRVVRDRDEVTVLPTFRMHPTYQEYLNTLRSAQCSQLTIRRYLNVFEEFAAWTPSPAPESITLGMLRQFAGRALKNGRERAPAGVNLRIAVLKSAFSYMHAEALIPTNPAARLVSGKLPRRSPRFLTAREMEALLRHLLRRQGRNRVRDVALVLALWQTALRVSELARLRWHQLDPYRSILSGVLLKGGDVLDIDLNDATLAVLQGLRSHARPVESDGVFARFDGAPLSVRAIEALFAKWREELGWSRPLHPHLLRHTHATNERALGVPLDIVAESLRHTGLRNVQVYAALENRALREALTRLSSLIPSGILQEFRKLSESTCVEEPFYEPGEAA